MSGFLDRNRIMKLFAELSEELEREGLRGHVYIVGGAAMIAGYGRQRSTHDVDGKIVSEKRGITEAAQRIAEKHDLPANWLNENATLFIPHKEDSQAATVFNSPNLVVTGASPRHLLAMKIDAGRPEDVEDIEWLIGKLKIDTIEEATEVHRETYPHSQLLTTSRNRLEEAFRRKNVQPSGHEKVAPPPPRPPKTTDAASGDEEQGTQERAQQRRTGDGVVRSIEQATDVIDRYEQKAAGKEREDPREATRKAMADHPGTLETDGGPNAPKGAPRRQQPELPEKSNREADRTKYSYE